MPSYPAGITVSNHASSPCRTRCVTDAPRSTPADGDSPPANRPCSSSPTCARRDRADLAAGFAIGVTTVFRYIQEALDTLAALAPSLRDAVIAAAGKAFVIVDGSLLRIDRISMATGRDRPYYSGKHKCHGINVQVIADPAGRLIWASPALPGARHDMGAVGEQ
jgi:hypothetical protein